MCWSVQSRPFRRPSIIFTTSVLQVVSDLVQTKHELQDFGKAIEASCLHMGMAEENVRHEVITMEAHTISEQMTNLERLMKADKCWGHLPDAFDRARETLDMVSAELKVESKGTIKQDIQRWLAQGKTWEVQHNLIDVLQTTTFSDILPPALYCCGDVMPEESAMEYMLRMTTLEKEAKELRFEVDARMKLAVQALNRLREATKAIKITTGETDCPEGNVADREETQPSVVEEECQERSALKPSIVPEEVIDNDDDTCPEPEGGFNEATSDCSESEELYLSDIGEDLPERANLALDPTDIQLQVSEVAAEETPVAAESDTVISVTSEPSSPAHKCDLSGSPECILGVAETVAT